MWPLHHFALWLFGLIRPRGNETRLPGSIVCNTISQPIDQLILNVMSLLEYSFRTVVLLL